MIIELVNQSVTFSDDSAKPKQTSETKLITSARNMMRREKDKKSKFLG